MYAGRLERFELFTEPSDRSSRLYIVEYFDQLDKTLFLLAISNPLVIGIASPQPLFPMMT